MQTDRGFVLHSAEQQFQATLMLGPLGMSTSQDVLFAIADGQGPQRHFVALGYAGWEAGQLEAELADNTAELSGRPTDPVRPPHDQRLRAAAARWASTCACSAPRSATHEHAAAAARLRLWHQADRRRRRQVVTGQAASCACSRRRADWQQIEALLREWQPDARWSACR